MPRLVPLAVAAVLLAAGPAGAVIKVLIPLKDVLAQEELIATAAVEAVDPAKPEAVFRVADHLKGKPPFARLAVDLSGDAEAKRDGHPKALLDRLAAGRTAVLFASPAGGGYAAFGFVDGTWFQLKGTKDGAGVRWALLHAEPYLRRTFKGTSAELADAVRDGLAGKRPPPPPDPKEPPGFGPPVEKKDGPRVPGPGKRAGPAPALHRVPTPFGVIPSFVLVGPLAVVAALFPAAFAGLAAGLRRWRAFLTVASVNGTAAVGYLLGREYLPDAAWAGPAAVGGYLLVPPAVGVVWAGLRYRRAAAADPAVTAPPAGRDVAGLAGLAGVAGLAVAGLGWWAGWDELTRGPGKEFAGAAVGLAVAAGYAGYRAATRWVDDGPAHPVRLSMSGETAGLVGMALFGITSVLVPSHPDSALTVSVEEAETEAKPAEPRFKEVKVWYETADYHAVLSGVTVAGDRVVFGVARQAGFRAAGAVVCVDRPTGRESWRFDADGQLKPVFATPAVDDGQVYAGEGLHTDADRKLYRLDAGTGAPSWPVPFPTTSHTEGTPRVADGKVYLAAGDDGLYCVAAADGKKVWHFPGPANKVHVDTPPALSGGKLFAGSGYKTRAVFCLDAGTGAEVWRAPVPLRSFAPPVVVGDRVAFGIGTGNLSEDVAAEADGPPERRPAGAVVCLDAGTGRQAWKADLPKGVHAPLAADDRAVYAGCRDGAVYALDRGTGKVRWRRPLGSPVVAGPVPVEAADGAGTLAVYAASTDGRVACLRPADGTVIWSRDLRTQLGRDVQILSTPTVVPAGGRRQIYLGAGLTKRNNGAKSAAVIRLFES